MAATRGARDYQEDAAAFRSSAAEPSLRAAADMPTTGVCDSGVAVLADGMGGHAGGALASSMVCEAFLIAAADDGPLGAENLCGALEAANAALAAKIKQDPLLSGMGSTLVGAAFGASGVEWVSVGDSPMFLFRRGELAVLNDDHSLAPELDRLVAAGQMSEDEARRDPRRHMLRSAVTGEEIDMVDLSRSPLALEAGDYVVLASDGIATLQNLEIARIVQGYANDGANAVATALIRAIEALREPHQDNATVLVVRSIGD
ncbi:MAG: PP2C family protein-serine/threonine phosphatase [Hyphomicrobium sp.]